MRRRTICQKSWSRRKHRELFIHTRSNLGTHMKFYHGTTALQHLIDPRHVTSLKEPSTSKKVLQQYCYNKDSMKSGSQIQWNAIATCEMFKTSWQTGKTRYERRFRESFKGPLQPFKGPTIHFGALIEYHPISPKDQTRIHQLG